MADRLKNKVAIVTGSGQGIGRAIARVFAAEGAAVVIATRSAQNGKETVESITKGGSVASLFPVDVGIPEQVDALIGDTAERYGRLDIVVHNAAIYPSYTIEALPLEILNRTLDVNLKACFFLSRRAIPHMRKLGGGRLLFTSSITGPRVANPGVAHYAASKGGMNAFIVAAAVECARDKITVNGVEPGAILTEVMAERDPEVLRSIEKYIPLGHMGDPDDIANTMLFLASDDAKYITGETIIVDGAMHRLETPRAMDVPRTGSSPARPITPTAD